MLRRHRSIFFILLLFALLAPDKGHAQCPELYDFFGNPSPNPYWYSCTGGNYILTVQSPDNIGTWTIDWGDGSAIEAGASLIPPASISHLYTATVDTFVVTFTETSSGCVITGVMVMEEATNASIQIPVGGLTQACAPATLDFVNSSTNTSETTVFIWDFGDGSPVQIFDWTNLGDTIQHTYLPGTVNCETVVTLTAENYCNTLQGGPSTATFNPIRIWDIDDAAIDASETILCYPDTVVQFTNVTNRNCFAQGNIAQRYEYWNFGDYWGLGYDSIVNWTPWPPALPYTIAYPGIGTYDVMMIDSNFCGLDTAYITIQIVPPPTAGIAIDRDTICSGESVNLTNLSGGGANEFWWNFGDGTGWQNLGAGNQTYTYFTPGDYIITLVANINPGTVSCTDTVTIPLHVLPSPAAVFSVDNDVGCDSLTVNFFDASVDAIGWFWDFDNGNTSTLQNPPAQFYLPGTYDVTLTVTSINGCTNTSTNQINVYTSPVVGFIPTSVCEDEVANFMDQSTSAPGDPIIGWFWDFGDGVGTSTQQNPNYIYTNLGSYDISLTVNTANCVGTDTIAITVEPRPTAGFTPDVTAGCTDLAVQFTNTSTGAVSYFWDFGDGNTSTAQDPAHIFVNPGTTDSTFNVMMVASTTFGCTDTAWQAITVYPAATAAFTHNGVPGCAPMPVDFVNGSTGAVSYFWDFGDGNTSVATNPTHLFPNQSLFINIYTVTLIATSANGCTDTVTDDIVVYPEPNFGFTTLPDSGCSPLTVTFPSVIGAVSYQWDFGDGNTGTGPTPTHTYVNGTTNNVYYNVTLIAISPFGCIDTTTSQVLVLPNPTAQFAPDQQAKCSPATFTLSNTSIGGTSYWWDYGDGNTSDTLSASHDYSYTNTSGTPVNYDIMLIAYTADGCTDTTWQTVTVYPEVVASFTSDTIGCSPLDIQFNNTSQFANSFEWDFGDGFVDVVMSPSHTYTYTGNTDTTFTVQMVATSTFGCTDTVWQIITVFPQPNAQFTATPTTQVFPNATVTLNNLSSAGVWNWEWDFGDSNTSTAQNPGSHTYGTWGDYTITLIQSNAYCSDTVMQTITIIPPPPVADFSKFAEGCQPLTVDFTDNSQYADTWSWNFGDGGTSNMQNPTYTYFNPGTYTVSLTVTGPGGTDTYIQVDSIIVRENAQAYFAVNPETVFVPVQPAFFFNFSSFATSYIWDFGDGNTSTEENPQHQYIEEGVYDVTLIANNQWGCPDTFRVPAAVEALTGGEIQFPNAFTPSAGGNGGAYDPTGVTNDVFFPVFSGVEEYHLMIFNRWGELIFESFDIAIGWDGTYRDKPVQQDVYVWKVNVKFTNGTKETRAGDVTLLR